MIPATIIITAVIIAVAFWRLGNGLTELANAIRGFAAKNGSDGLAQSIGKLATAIRRASREDGQ